MTPVAGEEPHDLVRALEDDLAALAAADLDLERDAEVAERTRIERGQVLLLDRLRAAASAAVPVEVLVAGGAQHRGLVAEVGDGWLVLGGAPAATVEHLVVLPAVVAVRGLGRGAAQRPGSLPARSPGSLLRGWCRDRSRVRLMLVDGTEAAGLASSVYADHLEVVDDAGGTLAVPFASLAVVSRPVPG